MNTNDEPSGPDSHFSFFLLFHFVVVVLSSLIEAVVAVVAVVVAAAAAAGGSPLRSKLLTAWLFFFPLGVGGGGLLA